MSVNIKVTGGLNIEWGQIDPKATGGLRRRRADLNCVICRGHAKRLWWRSGLPPRAANGIRVSLRL